MAAIYPLGHLKAMQRRRDPEMAMCQQTPLIFHIPPIASERFVMLLVQARVCPAADPPHEGDVVFELWRAAPQDFFSVSVVELEQSADIASFEGRAAD